MNVRLLLACLMFALVAGCKAAPLEATAAASPLPSPHMRRTLQPTWTPTASSTPRATVTPVPSPSATPTITPTAEAGQPFVIGYSVEGRPLTAYRFGEGETRRMIVAGIHGGYESNTTALAEELVADLSADPGLVPDEIMLYVLPLMNPDGVAAEIGPGGRANANGVDLNRNFEVNWKSEWLATGCWTLLPISAGTWAFSEPEAQALRDFIRANPLDALISYHSAKPAIFAGGSPPSADSRRLAQALSKVSGYPYPVSYGTCELTGQMVDWAAAQGAAAVDIELTYHAYTDLAVNRKVLGAFLEWKR